MTEREAAEELRLLVATKAPGKISVRAVPRYTWWRIAAERDPREFMERLVMLYEATGRWVLTRISDTWEDGPREELEFYQVA